MRSSGSEAGFTLIEALIALAIVALVVTSTLAFRTGALVDATEARNWRVARELAQEILSELRAGAREEPATYDMRPQTIPKMQDVDGWTYQIVIGEERIGSVESQTESNESTEEEQGDYSRTDRRAFQRERDDLRKARQKGMSFYEYRETSALEEQDRLEREELPESEDEFEQVAVFVFFPNARQVTGKGGEFSHYALKARISTLALASKTPEEAEEESGGSEDSGGTGGGNAESEGTGK